jgi:hypothetical protein
VVCMVLATDNASARFIYPVSGLKYPAPSMTALAAVAELTVMEGRLSASFAALIFQRHLQRTRD